MSPNPFTPPTADVADIPPVAQEIRYVGFWARFGAALLDTFFLLIVTLPLLVAVYGWAYFDEQAKGGLYIGPADTLISWGLPAVITIAFWLTRQATPGKMIVSAKVVDAKTGATLSLGQSIGRYLGYFVAGIPFGLGLLWVAFDKRKQGWHDKLAGTVVIRR